MIYVLGIDPGLASLGWSLVSFSQEGSRILRAGVIRTKPNPKRLRLRAGDSRGQRLRDISREALRLLQGRKDRRVSLLAIETSGGIPQNAKSALDLAASWGAVVALATSTNTPVAHYSPRDVRTEFGLPVNASKETTFEAAVARCLDDGERVRVIPKSYREHAGDAAAIAVAAGGSDLVKALMLCGAGEVA